MFFQFFKKKYWTANIICLVWESNPKYSHPFYVMGLCQDEVCAGWFVHVRVCVGEEWLGFLFFFIGGGIVPASVFQRFVDELFIVDEGLLFENGLFQIHRQVFAVGYGCVRLFSLLLIQLALNSLMFPDTCAHECGLDVSWYHV